MGDGLLSVDVTLHDPVLIDADGGKTVEHVLVAGVDAVEDEGDDDLLPGGTAFVPELGLFDVDNVADVLHDAVKRARGQHLVFVVVGDGDEEFGVAVVHGGPQVVAIVEGEVVGIAGGRRIYPRSVFHLLRVFLFFDCKRLTSHVGKLFAAALEVVAVLGLDGILDGTGHGVVDAEDGALDELDLAGGIAAEVALGRLALAPGLGRRGLAAAVGRGDAAGDAKAGGGIVHVLLLVAVHGVAAVGTGVLGIGGVGLGQTVAGGRPGRRGGAVVLMGVVKGAAKGALVLLEQRSRGIVVLWQVVLLNSSTAPPGQPVLLLPGNHQAKGF